MKRKAKFSVGQVVMNREYESGKLVDERTIKLKCPDRDHKGAPIWIDTWGNCYEESHLRSLTRREKEGKR